jgi:hypothetical protein
MEDFDTIVVASTLVSDHMIEVNEYALRQVAEAFGVDDRVYKLLERVDLVLSTRTSCR